MTADPAFQRARQPHQKEQRREAILDAAAALLDADGLDGASLAAIARRAGITKSNIYRYFESREAILLELLLRDQAACTEAIEHALEPLRESGDVGAVGGALAAGLAAQPRLCALVAALSLILEHNVSDETVLGFKRASAALGVRLGQAVHEALPGLPEHAVTTLVRYLHILIAGLHPVANPAPPAARALERPELAAFASDFEHDLRELLVTLLTGWMHRT